MSTLLDKQFTCLTGFELPRGGNSPEVVIPPELCEWWWPASDGSAASEKTRPGILEHVSHGCCRFVMFVVDVWVPQVVPAQNDADDGDDDDEPTSAMPHSQRQANTHRGQISRSGETPHSDIYIYIYI